MDEASQVGDELAMDAIGQDIDKVLKDIDIETFSKKNREEEAKYLSFEREGDAVDKTLGGLEGAAVGAGKTFTDWGLGIQQIANSLFPTEDRDRGAKYLDDQVAEKRRIDRTITDAPALSALNLGQYAPALASAPLSGASTAATLPMRMLANAGVDSAIGTGMAALEPTTEDESRLGNMGKAALIDSLLSVGGTALQTGIGKFVSPEHKALDDVLKAKGINLTTAELGGERSKLSDLLSFVSGSGEDTARKGNFHAAVKALEELRDKFTDQREVHGALENVLADLKSKQAVNTTVKGGLYNTAEDAISRAGPVTATNTRQAVRELLESNYPEEVRSILSNPQLNKLFKLDDTLTAADNVIPGSSVVDQFGNPLAAPTTVKGGDVEPISAEALRKVKQLIGENTQAVRGSVRGEAKKVYAATQADMGPKSDWALANPEASSAIREADEFFAHKYQPLYDRKSLIAHTLKSDDADKLRQLLRPNVGKRVQATQAGMSKQGKDELRGAFLQQAIDAAEGQGNSKTVSRLLDKKSTTDAIFEHSKSRDEIEALATALRQMDPHNSDDILKRLVSKTMLGNAAAAGGATAAGVLPQYLTGVSLANYLRRLHRKGAGPVTKALGGATRTVARGHTNAKEEKE